MQLQSYKSGRTLGLSWIMSAFNGRVLTRKPQLITKISSYKHVVLISPKGNIYAKMYRFMVVRDKARERRY